MNGEKGTSENGLLKFTRLVAIDQFVETIACMAQLKEHICIFDVIADLVLNDSGTVYQSWIMH